MTKTLIKPTLLASAIALAMPFAAQAGDTILFDPDGPANGYSAMGIDSFDLYPGNALAVDSVPLSASSTFTLHYQAEVNRLTSAAGDVAVPFGPDGPYELTATMTLPEQVNAAVDLSGSGIPNLVYFNHLAGGKFRIYYDDFSGGTNANDVTANSGAGYADGTLILEGDVAPATVGAQYSVSPTDEAAPVALDQFGTNNLGGVLTLKGIGNATISVNVTYTDPAFFPEPPKVVAVAVQTTLETPFDNNNPSLSVAGIAPDYGSNAINGVWDGSGTEDFQFESDANLSFTVEEEQEELACRFTGGGVDTDGNWDHTLESGEMVRNGAGNLPEGIDRAQFGGQAGANTGQQPQPKGEWTHHNQTGPSGDFTFHCGTASSPIGSEVVEIRCSDPGGCKPSGDPPSPVKQLDFDCIGTFKNIGTGKNAPTWPLANPIVTDEGNGNKTFDGTYHWAEINIDDLGEPGKKNDGAPDSEICPSNGFGEKGDVLAADCACPDFYRITIYNGVKAEDVTIDADGNITSPMNKTDVLYSFYGYIDGGNLQIHYPTGFDTK